LKTLFVNHSQKMCGVHQYGDRFFNIIKNDEKYISIYLEADNADQFFSAYFEILPDVVVFNWHGGTMSWLGQHIIQSIPAKTIVFHHEQFEAPLMTMYPDAFIAGSQDEHDPNRPSDRKFYILPRPLFEKEKIVNNNQKITVGSFGTGSPRKGFDEVCRKVCEEFDEAIINIHMTNPFFAHDNGAGLKASIEACQNAISNPKVELNITTDFITNDELAHRLQKNDINIFLYNGSVYGLCGIASVLDFPIGLETPIAINSNPMFRHVGNEFPEINLDNHSISEVLALGNYPSEILKNRWSNKNLRDKFYKMIMEV